MVLNVQAFGISLIIRYSFQNQMFLISMLSSMGQVVYGEKGFLNNWGPFHKSSYERFLLYEFVEPVLNYRPNEFVVLTNLCETGPWTVKLPIYGNGEYSCNMRVIDKTFTAFIGFKQDSQPPHIRQKRNDFPFCGSLPICTWYYKNTSYNDYKSRLASLANAASSVPLQPKT